MILVKNVKDYTWNGKQQSTGWVFPLNWYNWGTAFMYFVGLEYGNSKLKLQEENRQPKWQYSVVISN